MGDILASVEVMSMSVDWARVYEAHASELAAYLTKLVGDRDAAGDLTQDTFVQAIRSAERLREPAAALAWLYRIATNLAASYGRRRRIVALVPFLGEHLFARSADPSERLEDEHVRLALRSLTTAHASTLLLFYDAGFRREEIARIHGVSEETVKSRLARGRKEFIAAYRRLERGLAR